MSSPVDVPGSSPGEPFVPHVPGIDYGVLDSLLGYALREKQPAFALVRPCRARITVAMPGAYKSSVRVTRPNLQT